MRKIRKIKGLVFTLLLMGSLLISPSALAVGKSFTDLHQGDFGFDSVSNLVNEEIIFGYPDGSFQPGKPVSRAESAELLQRTLKFEVPEAGGSFKDVPSDAYYAKAAAALKGAGIFKGDGLGYFGPTDELTREQMASVLVRAFDLKTIPASEIELTDAKDISPSHLQDIKILYQNEVTHGVGNGKYDPKGPVTRAQFSVFTDRLVTKQKNSEEQAAEEEIEYNGVEEELEEEQTETGAPGSDGEGSELQITDSVVVTSDRTVMGEINQTEDAVKITYDLTSETDESKITSGSITVTKESTLELNDFPRLIEEFTDGDMKQRLNEGKNSLAIAEKIGVADLNTIRVLFGPSIIATGTLVDLDGNTLDVAIEFIVK